MTPRMTAYLESIGAGAAFAGLQAAYQALSQQGASVQPAPIAAAFLVAAMGYLVTALRWLQTLPEPPTAPKVPPA